MNPSPDHPLLPTPPEPAGHLPRELQCSQCGYLLRGLDSRGKCPECGQPITRSFSNDLADANPQWLRTLFTGTLLISLGILVNTACWAIFILSPSLTKTFKASIILIALLLGLLIGPILFVAGTWLLTRREPGLPSRFDNRPRMLTRGAALVASIMLIPFALQVILPYSASGFAAAVGWILGCLLRTLAVIGHLYFLESYYRRMFGLPSLDGPLRHIERIRIWILINLSGWIPAILFTAGSEFFGEVMFVLWIASCVASVTAFLHLMILTMVRLLRTIRHPSPVITTKPAPPSSATP